MDHLPRVADAEAQPQFESRGDRDDWWVGIGLLVFLVSVRFRHLSVLFRSVWYSVSVCQNTAISVRFFCIPTHRDTDTRDAEGINISIICKEK